MIARHGWLLRPAAAAVLLAGTAAAGWAQPIAEEPPPLEEPSSSVFTEPPAEEPAVAQPAEDVVGGPSAEPAGDEAGEDAGIVIEQPMDGPFYVTWFNAHVRAAPDGAAESLAELEFGDRITVTGLVEGGAWYRVETGDGAVGYVWREILAPVRLAGTDGPGGPVPGPVAVGDDTVAGAQPLGLLTAAGTSVSDSVGPSDPSDYYSFELTDWSRIDLRLTGLSTDADLTLLDQNGNPLTTSARGGAESEQITYLLGAGLYYIEVYMYEGLTNYTLSASAAPSEPPPPDIAGDSPATAYDLGLFPSAPATVEEWVGGTDVGDYFRITLTERARVSVTMGGLESDADLSLQDADGMTYASSYRGGAEPEELSAALEPGTYYVVVYPYEGVTPYILSVDAVPAGPAPADTAGNTPGAARALGTLGPQVWINEWVGPSDQADYFQVTVDRSVFLVLALMPETADVDVEIYDSTGETYLNGSARGGTESEGIVMPVDAGSYYIRVNAFAAESAYEMMIMAVPSRPKQP